MDKETNIILNGPWLDVEFTRLHSVLSWALLGGGWRETHRVLWHQVKNDDLSIDLDPLVFFLNRIEQCGRDKSSVGFLTSAPMTSFKEVFKECEGQWVRCISTLGLSNGVRVGAPSFQAQKVGTINILLQSSLPLSLSASIEASSVVTEARTLAVLEAQVPCPGTSSFLTGTGTDCIAIASPRAEVPEIFAGKHTLIGYLIGQAVVEATEIGIRDWKRRIGE